MQLEDIEELKREYTDRYVVVDSPRPELARWAGVVGQVMTINCNGRALVQFEGANHAWHDVELDDLRVVDKPAA